MRDIAYYIILPILICVLVPIDILIASIFIAYHLMLLYVMISIDYKYKLQVLTLTLMIEIESGSLLAMIIPLVAMVFVMVTDVFIKYKREDKAE